MRLSEEYEFDWKFYLGVVLVAGVLLSGFLIARRMILQARGKDVQQLLTKTNLGDIEFSRRQASTYVRGLAVQHNLTPRERKKAEEIYTNYFHERMQIWIDDRLQGQSEAHTRRLQAECRQRYDEEFNQLVKQRD